MRRLASKLAARQKTPAALRTMQAAQPKQVCAERRTKTELTVALLAVAGARFSER